ncbi:MAG: PD-(D/E)XK nuclease-like domain-containing protein [Gemmatimonadaceae bacterium]|nr:PD-(D/E)XK nuclease-like domain-containing protein [Gemmatimonadaceae bacterium]
MALALVTQDTQAALAEELARPETPAPGLYPGVDALVYHGWGGASQSRLKILRDHTPAHVKWSIEHPDEPTDAMRVGAAIHTCVLEPDRWGGLYVRGIEGDGRTKAVKEAREALAAEHPKAHILKPSDFDMCLAIRDAVNAHPHTAHLFEGMREASAVWRDPATGVLCRGRFDDVARALGCITDLKSCADASPFRFPAVIYNLGYHIQGAMYLRGAKANGIDADTFAIVAVEKEPPYAVAVYQLNGAALYDGERELEPLLERWAACEASGEWPGYPTDVVQLDLPQWAPQQITARVGGAA